MNTITWWGVVVVVALPVAVRAQTIAPVDQDQTNRVVRIAPVRGGETNNPIVRPGEFRPSPLGATSRLPTVVRGGTSTGATTRVALLPADVSGVAAMFEGADAVTKQNVGQALVLIQGGHYDRARQVLNQIKVQAHLAPEQQQKIDALLAQLQDRPDLPQ